MRKRVALFSFSLRRLQRARMWASRPQRKRAQLLAYPALQFFTIAAL